MANGLFKVGEDTLFDRGRGSDQLMPISSSWDFFFFCMCLKRKQDGQRFACSLEKELGTTQEDRATDESRCPLTWDLSHYTCGFSFLATVILVNYRLPSNGRSLCFSEQYVHFCIRGVYMRLSQMEVSCVIKCQGVTLNFIITASNQGKNNIINVWLLIC